MRNLFSRVGISLVALYAITLGIVALHGWVVQPALEIPESSYSSLLVLVISTVSVLSGCFSLLVVWHGTPDRATLLVAFLVSAVSAPLVAPAADFAKGLVWVDSLLRYNFFVFLWVSVAAFLRLSAIYPARLNRSDFSQFRGEGTPWYRRPGRWISTVLQTLSLSDGSCLQLAAVGILVGVPIEYVGFIDLSTPQGIVLLVSVSFAISLAVSVSVVGYRNMRAGYRRAERPIRAQVIWGVAGTALAVWLVIFSMVTWTGALFLGNWHDSQSSAALDVISTVGLFGGIPVSIQSGMAMAIFYRGELQPGLVLTRAALVGLTTMLLLLIFAAIETLIPETIWNQLPASGFTNILLAGGVSAAILWPFRGFLLRLSTFFSSISLPTEEPSPLT